MYLITIRCHAKEKDISFVIQKERVSRKAIARKPSVMGLGAVVVVTEGFLSKESRTGAKTRMSES